MFSVGQAGEGIRTPDKLLTKEPLCQAELPRHPPNLPTHEPSTTQRVKGTVSPKSIHIAMLQEYIPKAIEAQEESPRGNRLRSNRDDQFDILVDLIADESRIDPAELRITEENYKNRIKGIIRTIADADDPISEFHVELSEVEDEVKDRHREFTILFPWNFRSTNVSEFETPVEIRDLTFKRISRTYWDNYREEAEERDTFDVFLEELPRQQNRSSPFSLQKHWMVEYEAASREFAIDKVADTLELLSGKITLSAYTGFISDAYRNTNWKYGQTVLLPPLCYIVLEDDEYSRYYTSYNFTPRRKFSLLGRRKRRFNEYYPMLPDFKGDLNDIEERLVTALKAYYSAISEPASHQSFLDYWRCLEAATLTQDEDYSAEDPLKRGRAAVRPDDIEISDGRIERLVEKRNPLVHEGARVNISEGDLIHLKSLCEHSMWFLVTDRDKYSLNEFDFFFEYGAKQEESIIQAKHQREKQIHEKEQELDQIEQIMEWFSLED